MFVMATEQSGVDGEGFQRVAFPATNDRARFLSRNQMSEMFNDMRTHHPYTATGKLKAEITATNPRGFGTVEAVRRIQSDIYAHITFQYRVTGSLRRDHLPVHHSRKAHSIITL